MPFEPLRFVHAAGLFVDHQLQDLPQMDDEAVEHVDDATTTAFETVVGAAIDHRADFLLLAGNSFSAEDSSLRAEVLLRRSFERLDEHDIRVFIAPGAADPPSDWRAIRHLPDNVTTLLETNDDPVAVIRDGKVIASIGSLDVGSLRSAWTKRESNSHKGEPQRGPLKIGLLVPPGEGLKSAEATSLWAFAPLLADCGLDYLALGGPGERQSIAMKAGLAHHPGAAQSIAACETGPRGCTLIDFDQAGALTSSLLPTAVVRRERFELVVDEQTSDQQLASRFRESLEQRTPELGEKLWLIEWTIRGAGPLFDAWEREPRAERFIESMGLTAPGGVRLIHSCRVIAGARALEHPARTETMLADFLSAVENGGGVSREALASCFAENAPTNAVWSRALEPLIGKVDGESVAAEVRRLGTKWFTPASAEGSAR